MKAQSSPAVLSCQQLRPRIQDRASRPAMGHKCHNHKERAIDEDCCLLSEENRLLKKCLHLLRENSALEISTILSAIIAFCNGKFRKKFAADFAAVIENHQEKFEKKASEPRVDQLVQNVCGCPCGHTAEQPDEEMYAASKSVSPSCWELPERDLPLPEGEKWTQTYFPKKPRWPRLSNPIGYDTVGQSAHIRSHLNTKTPMVTDMEFDPYYLKCLVLATYYKVLANVNRWDEMDYSMYYPLFKKHSIGQIMQRLCMFPPRAILGARLSRGWRPRSAGRKQSTRSVSRRCRRKKMNLVEDDLHVSACLRRPSPCRGSSLKGLKGDHHVGFNYQKHVCTCCGNVTQTYSPCRRNSREGDSSAVCSDRGMSTFGVRKDIKPILERVIKNVEFINGETPVPENVKSLSISHERTSRVSRDEGVKDPEPSETNETNGTTGTNGTNRTNETNETNDEENTEQTRRSSSEKPPVSQETSEATAETEQTSTSNNNPQDFSTSSCCRTDSRETMHGYATIDPLYAQGKRSFRSPELVVARSYRSWNPPKPSPVLHRNSRSDHWLLRAYGNSQRAVSASPPTRGDPDARPPYGHGKRSEESTPRGRMGTRKAVRDTPREGKNMPRWGKDLSNVEEEPLREGREERPRDLRHFYQSSSVDPRFEPQAFSSPFVDTLDPQTSFVETNYGNEVDRNSSLTSPTLDREVPEKEVSNESRTCLKSPHIFAAATQPGGAGMIICRTEYLQSGPKGETALDQKSSAPVPDMDFPDRNYVSAKLPVSSRSRHGEDGQGLKSLQPAVYVPRAHGGSPLSLYEEKEERRADSDDNSVCSSRVSSRHQDQTFGGQSTSASTKIFRTSFELVGRSSDLNLAKPRSVTPMGVVKQAWTASSSSHITVASTSAVQLIPPALMTTGKNIVGEIAFQLERRILDYVFANHLPAVELESSGMARKRRFYGYTVNNIGEMINREALSGDYYSKGTERMLRERLRTLLDILTPLGYDLTDHARFSQDIINKYGLLSHIPVTNPGDPETEVGINGVEVEHLQNAIVCMADTEAERSNLLLILDCLRMLAIEDGRPLFVW